MARSRLAWAACSLARYSDPNLATWCSCATISAIPWIASRMLAMSTILLLCLIPELRDDAQDLVEDCTLHELICLDELVDLLDCLHSLPAREVLLAAPLQARAFVFQSHAEVGVVCEFDRVAHICVMDPVAGVAAFLVSTDEERADVSDVELPVRVSHRLPRSPTASGTR